MFLRSSMNAHLKSIAEALDAKGCQYSVVNEEIQIPLPKEFDTLVIEIWNDAGEDSITLLNGSFHSHGDIEASEHGLDTREEGIVFLVESIFNGHFKMVRRINKDGSKENTIWDTFSMALVNDEDDFEIVET
ncbi:hypothetical protein [Glaciecola petra]|uniref:Uncharacterized protein n=1 Tax=Glaciecola petra TaxID=3075602 RepID=A0ABU2ZUT2_9ALTE|nr:hypothetical protein [Aestuariibacter sp. P117]MDT0596399.1 hypothetical protein [Aestuariibacter sp. P117]